MEIKNLKNKPKHFLSIKVTTLIVSAILVGHFFFKEENLYSYNPNTAVAINSMENIAQSSSGEQREILEKIISSNYSNESIVKALPQLDKVNINTLYNNFSNNVDLVKSEIKEKGIEKTEVVGDLMIIDTDDFDSNNLTKTKNTKKYYINTTNEQLNFYPIDSNNLIPNQNIKIYGYRINNNMIGTIEDKDEKQKTLTKKAQNSKQLILLVNLADSTPSTLSANDMYNKIFNGDLQKFYKEQSYGRIYFSGDVYGWINSNQNSTNICSSYNASLSNQEIGQFILDNNIDLNNYENFTIINNCPNNITSLTGMSMVGGNFAVGNNVYHISQAIINTNDIDGWFWGKLAHEWGHILGLKHSNGLDCGDATLGDNCDEIEFGNNFDIMGSGWWGLAKHFSSFQKEILGWIPETESLKITESGTYTINDLEKMGNTVKFAKIQTLENYASLPEFPIYLEWRKPIGYDNSLNNSNQNGLFIYRSTDTNFFNKTSRLLNMHPNSSADWFNKMQNVVLHYNNNQQSTKNNSNTIINNNTIGSEIFTDPETGITIGPIKNISNSEITFNVKIETPICMNYGLTNNGGINMNNQHGQPEQTIFKINAGDSINFVAYDVVNNDKSPTCASKNIIGEIIFPSIFGINNYLLGTYGTNEIVIIPTAGRRPFYGNNVTINSKIPSAGYILVLNFKDIITGQIYSTQEIKIEVTNNNLLPTPLANSLNSGQKTPSKIISKPTLSSTLTQLGVQLKSR
ncbi:MAG: hypothetical protein WCX46_03180 [Candidatus Paceibacterota bacterium]